MKSKNIYNFQADIFKALGNPVRIQAVELLKDGELCFSEILEHLGGLKSTLSQNLSILVEAGILNVRKDSRCNYFSVKSPKAFKICQLMRELVINNMEEQTIVFSKIKSIS
ncbi:MAG TPA: metalloregulator ArsR/SmtB family transcription factor [Flavipsychrobacter sp.]|nr:metalloregulator ArsR/SmtB family transcription factor [Flavipsychrobacter sp.]